MTYTTEQIEELLSKRTPGKWEWDDPAIGDLCSNDFSDSVLYVTNHDKVGATPADKAFIAAAPEIIRQLSKKAEARELELAACWRALSLAHGKTQAVGMVVKAEQDLARSNTEDKNSD